MRLKTFCAAAVAAGTLTVVPAAAAAPPSNDAFEAAAPLGGPDTTVTGTVAEATRQAGEPLAAPHTVWYTMRSAQSGRVAVELPTIGAYGAVLGVYRGATLSTLEQVGRSRGGQPRVAFRAAAGETVRVVVGAEGYGTGAFRLRVREAPFPANDAFADPQSIRVPGEYAGNLADATTELGEPGRHSHSVWYRIRPKRTGRLTIDLDAPGCMDRPSMALYTGRRVARLKRVRAGVPIRLVGRRGRTYRLAVSCHGPGTGDFVVTLADQSIEGRGIKLDVDEGQSVESVLARGLRMTVSAERRAGVGIQLRVSRRTMRRLGLRSPILGRASGPVDYEQSLPVDLRLSRAARRALRDVEHLTATIRLEVLRSDSPDNVLTRRVRL